MMATRGPRLVDPRVVVCTGRDGIPCGCRGGPVPSRGLVFGGNGRARGPPLHPPINRSVPGDEAAPRQRRSRFMSATNDALREAILGPSPSKEEILARVEAEGIQFVNLQFTDVMGIVKSVTIPARVFGHVIDGGQW